LHTLPGKSQVHRDEKQPGATNYNPQRNFDIGRRFHFSVVFIRAALIAVEKLAILDGETLLNRAANRCADLFIPV
jgi:hypothetical protein